jgi:hypothetical protein
VKSERERENEFQLFLYLSQEIPAKSAVEFIRKECVDEGSVVNFCSHSPRSGIWVVEAVQGSVQAEEEVSVVNLSKGD